MWCHIRTGCKVNVWHSEVHAFACICLIISFCPLFLSRTVMKYWVLCRLEHHYSLRFVFLHGWTIIVLIGGLGVEVHQNSPRVICFCGVEPKRKYTDGKLEHFKGNEQFEIFCSLLLKEKCLVSVFLAVEMCKRDGARLNLTLNGTVWALKWHCTGFKMVQDL
jgi:hypothetical protein